MTSWYKTGTVTATNASTTVTGSLTAWLSNVKVGDVLTFDSDSKPYEVVNVTSNTQITIGPAYAGTTGSAKAYRIARVSTSWNSVSEISISLADILSTFSEILTGVGVPSNALGQNGDIYLREDTPEYYKKASGSWGTAVSLGGAQGPAGPSYQATSTTSLAIGTGSKTFTLAQTSRGYTIGQRLRASNTAAPANYMEGTVTSYSGTTLVLSVDRTGGSGTLASWNVNIAGDVGPANSLSIGTVTTGAAGSSATATITGTAPTQTLSFTIPRGATGAGATISVGNVTTGAVGSGATVTNVGTSTAAVFDFSIPVGATGATGATGPTGATGAAGARGAAGADGADGASIRHLGAYNAGTAYVVGDIVERDGSSWHCIASTTGNAPPSLPTTSNTWWELVARAGSDGTGSVNSVNGQTSADIVIDGQDVEAGISVANYTSAGSSIADHLTGIDNAFGLRPSWSEVTLASASTTDLGSVAQPYVNITGTTTITSFGTVANLWKNVRFVGALTLIHNATTLILPGAANIVTAAGDTAIIVSNASGQWRVLHYTRAAGVPATVSSAASAVVNQTSLTAIRTALEVRLRFVGAYTINDDSVATIVIGTSSATTPLLLTQSATSGRHAMVLARAASTFNGVVTLSSVGVAFTLTTGALTGTTGTDGNTTLSADTSGNFYIENRSGGALAFNVWGWSA